MGYTSYGGTHGLQWLHRLLFVIFNPIMSLICTMHIVQRPLEGGCKKVMAKQNAFLDTNYECEAFKPPVYFKTSLIFFGKTTLNAKSG